VPADLPPGTYRGALVLQGFRNGAVPVAVEVKRPASARKSTRPTARKTSRPAAARKSASGQRRTRRSA
jgi:hypothetical protein